MIDKIQVILYSGNTFTFKNDALKTASPTRYLKAQTSQVPNEEGMYTVFSSKVLNPNEKHFQFNIKGQSLELVYFGKAGGFNSKGGIIKQGLHGRINNVVSDSSRRHKDMARAKYWKFIMDELDIPVFHVFYLPMKNAKAHEDTIYQYLNVNQLTYPILNKQLGRSKKN